MVMGGFPRIRLHFGTVCSGVAREDNASLLAESNPIQIAENRSVRDFNRLTGYYTISKSLIQQPSPSAVRIADPGICRNLTAEWQTPLL
jgi:hypothetical protein